MSQCQNQHDIKILGDFIRMWRDQDIAEYKKRRDSGEDVPHRNVIFSKKGKSPCK